ncbi:Sortilin [Bagarius yarrelli]|uniref:Sortilin n=1 Tax=Bagarius yarrelli TaxID=175774 RepID=A0A556V9S4_BAGYA|nr:Sortilin [Bagarius yarrelli]
MRVVCWPVAVLLVSAALCLDFEHAPNHSRTEITAFLRRLKWRKSPGSRDSAERRLKRSEESAGESCHPLLEYKTSLQEDTHTHVFNDVSGSVSLAWVGDGTGRGFAFGFTLRVCGMRPFPESQKPGTNRISNSSSPEDHGKTFQDVTDLLNNTFIMTHFGIAIGPDNSGKVILTGNLSEGKGSRILRSSDFGKSFTPSDLPFQVLMQITYNPQNNSVLAVISTLGEVWDMAQLPTVGHEQFYSILSSSDDMVFVHVDEPGDSGMGVIYTSDNRGIVFSKSLERHLYTSTGGETDFTVVSSLRGSAGDAVSILSPDVYVSDDGGYTWTRALKGPHHYAILDSGGLLVAVEHNPIQPILQIKFSTDEGQCWYRYNFTDTPLYFTGLASEPGARSMSLSLWGEEKDYVPWLAHSDNTGSPNDGCLLGYKEKHLRLRKNSACRKGRDFIITKQQPTPCPCTLDDFQCDFGYYRTINSSECVEQPELKGQSLEFCLRGRKEQLQTSGYRKIPGNRCEGGTQPERKVIDLSKKCVSNLVIPELLSESQSGSVASVVSVIVLVLLLCAVAGALLVKKYVCGGRFLVHRYSEMQRNVEANAIEGVDDVDTTEADKTHYNNDSDEVSITARFFSF